MLRRKDASENELHGKMCLKSLIQSMGARSTTHTAYSTHEVARTKFGKPSWSDNLRDNISEPQYEILSLS